MESTINQRIAKILETKGYKSKRAFAQKIGISQTSFNDILNGAEPKHSTLNKVLSVETDINPDWLVTGEGEMLRPSIHIAGDANDSVVAGHINGNVDNSRSKQEIHGVSPTSHASVHIHHDETKDKMIEEQKEQVSMSFSILVKELKNFCSQLERKDDYIISLTNENREIDRENLKRYDANMERLKELIQMIDEQNKRIDQQTKRIQDRADKLVDMLINKINVDVDINKNK